MRLSTLVRDLNASLLLPGAAKTFVPGTADFAGGTFADFEVVGVAPIDQARAGQITFLTNPEYAKYAAHCQAGAVITAAAIEQCPVPQIIHPNPYYAFARTAQHFCKPKRSYTGISPQSSVAASAKIGKNVTIFPFVTVSADAEVGDDTVLFSGVFVGEGAFIGAQCELRANVVVEYGCILGNRVLVHGGTVIGADGFGFAPGDHDIAKIPQVGIVRIADDVEIGPGCTIDRAAMGETRIGRGTKLDSQVHVAHNVVVGEHCMLCGQSGMAGSAKLGNWITIAGQSGVNSHVKICDHVTLGAMSAIVADVESKGTYIGFPAEPASAWHRQMASLRRMPMVEKRLRAIEAAVEELGKLMDPKNR